MMRTIILAAAFLATANCVLAQQPSIELRLGQTIRPLQSDSAILNWRADVAPFDSAGECRVTRTGGSSATIVSAGYPSLAESKTQVTVTFDSAGHVARYSESRGIAPSVPLPVTLTPAERDSAYMARRNAVRSTMLSFDYAVDHAMIMNTGGGRPAEAVLTNVRNAEKRPNFGNQAERMERMRKLCGV